MTYELTSGAALADVESLCRHVARSPGATFGTATTPKLTAVQSWLTLSGYWIGGLLSRYGLDPAQDDAPVVGILQQLNVYDTCWKVEASLPNEDSTGAPNARMVEFSDRRMELVEMIENGTLVALGAHLQAGGAVRSPLVGGLSISRKRYADDDLDATQHRVKRNQFINPGAPFPRGEDATIEL